MDSEAQGAPGSGAYFWQFGNVEFHEGRWELKVDGAAVELERKPLELLAHLLRHANQVVTRDELIDHVWASRVVVDAALTNAIGKLRKAIDDRDGSVVVTVPRVGYRLSASVHSRPVAALPASSRLQAGDPVPRRTSWLLDTALQQRDIAEVWIARHAKTRERRVFKFSLGAGALAALRREVTLSRYLGEALGPREDLLPALDWDFETSPYWVEYPYGGASLLDWAEAGGLAALDTPQRIALFLRVCDTIAAAHSAGVLHKDIKPANILIDTRTDSDIAPPVRVTDFGSGELLDSASLDAYGITGQGLTRPLGGNANDSTPLYAAPELLAGHAPTTRTDVYALGVLLYQLLAGDLRQPLTVGFAAQIDDPLLASDIEAAAHGDPDQRPASAAELAHRVRALDTRRRQQADARALAQRAERAERDLLAARTRRPWLIATAVVLLVGLLAASGFAWDAARKGREAQRQLALTVALGDFLIDDIIAAADPLRAGRSGLTVREALDNAAPGLQTRFAGQPLVAATIHDALGRSYYQLAAFEPAVDQFRLAAEALEASGQSGSQAWLQARLFEAESLARLNRLDEARALHDALEPMLAESTDLPLETQVRAAQTEAQIAFMAMNFIGAVAPLEHAVELTGRLDPPNPRLDTTVRLALLSARTRAGMPQQAEAEGRYIVADLARTYGNDAPMTLGARHTVLRAVVMQGREAEVEDEYRQLVDDLTRVLGPAHEVTLLARQGLMHVLTKVERWPEVERIGRDLVEQHTQRIGADGLHTLATANGVGLAILRQGKTEAGVAYLQEALSRSIAALGEAHPVSNAMRLNLGHGQLALGRTGPAQHTITELTTHGGVLLQVESDAVGELALLKGWLGVLQDQREEARAHLLRAREQLLKKNPEDYWLVQQATQLLASLDGGGRPAG